MLRYRCRVGHAFSPESLLASQNDALEEALWAALRALEEKVELSKRLAERMRTNNQLISAGHFEEQAEEGRRRADLLRDLLEGDR